eukprot:6132824-Pleurochrysis_carterae.AAC.1
MSIQVSQLRAGYAQSRCNQPSDASRAPDTPSPPSAAPPEWPPPPAPPPSCRSRALQRPRCPQTQRRRSEARSAATRQRTRTPPRA